MRSFRAVIVKILLLVKIAASAVAAAAELRTTDFDLLVANRSEIYLIKRNGDVHRYPTDSDSIVDVDHHPDRNLLVWIDRDKSEVHSRPLDANESRAILKQTRTWRPIALAVDRVSDKVYVIDELGRTVDVSDLAGGHHGIVLGSYLTHPTDIKLDAREGYAFVLDGRNIVRASMDGSSPVVVVRNDASPTNGINVDVAAKRIYWKRKNEDLIVSGDYSGGNVEIVEDSSRKLEYRRWSKFAVLNGTVYWAGNLANYKGGRHCSKAGNNPVPVVRILYSNVTTVANPCENADCQHACALKPKSNETDGHGCICDVGYVLAADAKSCTRLDKFLLFSLRSNLKSLVLDARRDPADEPFAPICTQNLKNRGIGNAVFGDFDYDYRDNSIYYVLKYPTSGHGVIFKTHPNDSADSNLFHRDASEYYQSVAIDWTTGNLYHANSVECTINVANTRKDSRLTLIRKLLWPEDVAVHPARGYVYFLQTNQISRQTVFSRARTDGSNLTVFDGVVLKSRCGFAIDRQEDRIYWFGIKDKAVRHSDLDMNDVKTLRIATNPYTIAVHDAWVYVGSATGEGVWRYDKRTGERKDLVLRDALSEVRSVKVFDPETRRVNESHPCSVDNGGCRDFCFGYLQSNGSWTKVCAGADV